MGVSTITWWDWTKAELGDRTTTTPFYRNFRATLNGDLKTSERLRTNGLIDILLDTLKYCFKGDKTLPPDRAILDLERLQHPSHALTTITKKGTPVTYIAQVPSWLT